MCFGDSNTWGYDADSGERFPFEKRWTSILQSRLGDGYNIIVEGLNGRTTVWDDPFSPYRKGADALPYALLSHAPLDLIVLMLGTNDSKNFFRNDAVSIGRGIRRLVEMIQSSDSGTADNAPRILVVSPVPAVYGDPDAAQFDLREFGDVDGHSPVALSAKLADEYRRVAAEFGCDFLDAGLHADVSGTDGIHLSSAGHAGLGKAVAAKITEMGL